MKTSLIHKIAEMNPNVIHMIDGNECVMLSSIDDAFKRGTFSNLICKSSTGRLNFFSPDLERITQSFPEQAPNTYSWFVFARDVTLPIDQPVAITANFNIEELDSSQLNGTDRDLIISAWNSQYVNQIQGARSTEQKVDLLQSIQTTLSEGKHLLFRNKGVLVGHASYVDDLNPVLQLPNYYLHVWTDQLQESSIRAQVLANFFARTRKLDKALTAGIAVNNYKSIRTFTRAGFLPRVLSIGIY